MIVMPVPAPFAEPQGGAIPVIVGVGVALALGASASASPRATAAGANRRASGAPNVPMRTTERISVRSSSRG